MRRFASFALPLAGLALALIISPAFGQSQPQAGGQNQSFTLRPGGTATITFEAFCTDFGKNFPANVQAPNAVAPDKIRAALAYAQSQGLTTDEAKAVQVQNAIWQLSGATGAPAGDATAQQVVGAANTAPANPQGTSLIDAAKSGQVKLSVAGWQPLGSKVQIGQLNDYFYGRGTLTVQNTSQQELNLFLPVGALLPPTEQGSQTMAAYSTSLQVQNPTPTPAPTAVPTVAPTAAPTAATSAPQRLPETSEMPGSPVLLMAAAALFLCAAGLFTRRHLTRR
jgi:hypothetical protein